MAVTDGGESATHLVWTSAHILGHWDSGLIFYSTKMTLFLDVRKEIQPRGRHTHTYTHPLLCFHM